MTLDITNIGKINKNKSCEELKDTNIKDLADSLGNLLKKPKLKQEDKNYIYELLKAIQVYTPLSKEFILYLIYTTETEGRKVISLMGSRYFTSKMKNVWNKIKRIIKENSDLKMITKYSSCQKHTLSYGSQISNRRTKTYHFLKELK